MFRGTTGRVFMLVCLMYFIMYVDRVNVSVAAPLIKADLHLSNTQLGFVLSGLRVLLRDLPNHHRLHRR